MAKPNTQFQLSTYDLDVIETALRARKAALNDPACVESAQEKRGIHDLLGRLHNQKVFYRPKKDCYVSG